MPNMSSHYTNTCTLNQLCIIDDARLMTESFIDDALLQAMSHMKHTLIQFFGIVKLFWYTWCHISD